MAKKYHIIEKVQDSRTGMTYTRLWANAVTRKQAAMMLIELIKRFPEKTLYLEIDK